LHFNISDTIQRISARP